MFPVFPYSDMYTLNLDWVIDKVRRAEQATKNIQAFADVDATATATGDPMVDLTIVDGHYRFEFGLPTGKTGPQGPEGPAGDDGDRGASLFVGTQLSGHHDGNPFAGPNDGKEYIHDDVYINKTTGELYRCSVGDTGTDSQWRYMYTLAIEGAQPTPTPSKQTITIVTLNRPANSGALAGGAREGRENFGTVNVPAHTVAVPVFWNQLHWYYATSGTRIGNQSDIDYNYYVNDTDSAVDVDISGFVLNISSASQTTLDLGRMTFNLIPVSAFEYYEKPKQTESASFESAEFETGTPPLSIGTMVQPGDISELS